MVRIVALALIATLAAAGAAFAQTCPANYRGLSLTTPSGTPIVQAVRRDSSCTAGGFCFWRSRWDNALGTAFVTATDAGCSGELGSQTDFGQYTSDDFVLTGPSGPTPVSFQVFLHVTGAAGNGCHTFCDPFTGCTTTCTPGNAKVALTDGTQTSSIGPLAIINTTLALTMSKTVGQHFHLDRSIYVHTFCGSSTTASTSLEIVLPPGYGMTSCYGYAVSGPVEALHASWGRVKTLYR